MWPFSTIKRLKREIEELKQLSSIAVKDLRFEYDAKINALEETHRAEITKIASTPIHETFTSGDKPRFIMTGEVDDNEDEGILMELNWNPSFVRSLKRAGVKGDTDDMIVHRWLTSIAVSIAKDIEQQDVEERGTQPLDLL